MHRSGAQLARVEQGGPGCRSGRRATVRRRAGEARRNGRWTGCAEGRLGRPASRHGGAVGGGQDREKDKKGAAAAKQKKRTNFSSNYAPDIKSPEAALRNTNLDGEAESDLDEGGGRSSDDDGGPASGEAEDSQKQ